MAGDAPAPDDVAIDLEFLLLAGEGLVYALLVLAARAGADLAARPCCAA